MMLYSCCTETHLLVCEIYPNLLVREDGMVKNIGGHFNAAPHWRLGGYHTAGYLITCVPGNHKKYVKVHRLVAEAFISNPRNLTQVDHISGKRDDNSVANLRWVSPLGNSLNKSSHRAGRLVGACLMKNRNKPWRAGIKVGKNFKHIGYYYTELEAHVAYLDYLKTNNINKEN